MSHFEVNIFFYLYFPLVHVWVYKRAMDTINLWCFYCWPKKQLSDICEIVTNQISEDQNEKEEQNDTNSSDLVSSSSDFYMSTDESLGSLDNNTI